MPHKHCSIDIVTADRTNHQIMYRFIHTRLSVSSFGDFGIAVFVNASPVMASASPAACGHVCVFVRQLAVACYLSVCHSAFSVLKVFCYL